MKCNFKEPKRRPALCKQFSIFLEINSCLKQPPSNSSSCSNSNNFFVRSGLFIQTDLLKVHYGNYRHCEARKLTRKFQAFFWVVAGSSRLHCIKSIPNLLAQTKRKSSWVPISNSIWNPIYRSALKWPILKKQNWLWWIGQASSRPKLN